MTIKQMNGQSLTIGIAGLRQTFDLLPSKRVCRSIHVADYIVYM